MTRLRCVCGAVLEGTDDELLAAVERHVHESHPSEAVDPQEPSAPETAADDEEMRTMGYRTVSSRDRRGGRTPLLALAICAVAALVATGSGRADFGADDAAPPEGYTLLESITVPTRGGTVTSANALETGVTYRLRATGTFTIGGPGQGDAEYAFDFAHSRVQDRCDVVNTDLGIGIDDSVNDTSKSPSWGGFSPTHVYEIDFVGTGASIALNYHDCNYGDNVGSLRVHVFEPMGGPNVDFDWSTPSRYGADGNGDGLIDSFEPDGPLAVAPGGFRVDFVAAGTNACSGPNTRTWTVDGAEIGPGDPRVVDGDPASCSFSYEFSEEGTYQVRIEIDGPDGAVIASASHEVVVQDFLIVSIGDSVASGEGNPDAPPAWQDEQCHRSALAGPARAARAIEAADPRTSVTFVHLACSGATVNEGLLGGYGGIVEGALLPPQVDAMGNLIGGRELDALLISVGANDVKFSQVLKRCAIPLLDCSLDEPGSARRFFDRQLLFLPGRYAQLGLSLQLRDVPSSRTYVTEYFDALRDDSGGFCDGILGGVTSGEAEWASTDMLPRLNAVLAAGASANGWRYVSGIFGEFGTHGYCAIDHWVVQLSESLASQGDENGTFHPNAPGHIRYGDRIRDALVNDLYDGGDLSKPRPPA